MPAVYKYFLLFLSLLTGAVFLYSAYTKLVPIQAFEYTLVEDAHLYRILAAYAARSFIGIEGGLGALILFHFFGKAKWVLKAAFALLSVFSVYLLYLWISKGNNVNCGCFGDTIWMSPKASLIKNMVLLAILFLLIRYHNGFSYRWTTVTAPVLLLSTIIVIFLVFPVFKPYKIDLTVVYSGKDVPATDLGKGKHIIAFLSPSCIHCRRAGNKMYRDLKSDTTLPFFMVIGGTTSDLTDFWKASHAENIPHIRMDVGPFMKYTHGVFPYIIWVNNGIVEEETGYVDLSTPAIEKWMQY